MSNGFDSLPYFSDEDGLQVRRGPRDEVPYAVFEGALPTLEQVKTVRRKGYGVHILSSPTPDLGFLAQFTGLTHLSIAGYALDTRQIGRIATLLSLHLMVGDAPNTELDGLSELREYRGVSRGFESVLSAPQLKVAELHDVSDGVLPAIPGKLRELSLSGARRVERLAPALAATPSELRTLSVKRSGFDGDSRYLIPTS